MSDLGAFAAFGRIKAAADARAASSSSPGFGGAAAASLWLQGTGALLSMVGSFFQAQQQKDLLKAQALDLEHESRMSAINARNAEADAQAILEAGRDEAAQVTAAYGQAKAEEVVRQGASGFVTGSGSNAEVTASIELAKRIERSRITQDTLRAAGQRRMQAVDLRNRGVLAGVSAENTRRTARTVSPALAGLTAGISGGASLLSNYAQFRSGRFSR